MAPKVSYGQYGPRMWPSPLIRKRPMGQLQETLLAVRFSGLRTRYVLFILGCITLVEIPHLRSGFCWTYLHRCARPRDAILALIDGKHKTEAHTTKHTCYGRGLDGLVCLVGKERSSAVAPILVTFVKVMAINATSKSRERRSHEGQRLKMIAAENLYQQMFMLGMASLRKILTTFLKKLFPREIRMDRMESGRSSCSLKCLIEKIPLYLLIPSPSRLFPDSQVCIAPLHFPGILVNP